MSLGCSRYSESEAVCESLFVRIFVVFEGLGLLWSRSAGSFSGFGAWVDCLFGAIVLEAGREIRSSSLPN